MEYALSLMKQRSIYSVKFIYGNWFLQSGGCSIHSEMIYCFMESKTWIGKRSRQSDADNYLILKIFDNLYKR